MRDPVRAVLELHTSKNCRPYEIFYKYKVGDYVVWFTQHQDNGKRDARQNLAGCIFQVHVALYEGAQAFPLRIYESVGSDKGYPNSFEIDLSQTQSLRIQDYEQFDYMLKYSKQCLDEIVNLLFRTGHYSLYKQRSFLDDGPKVQKPVEESTAPQVLKSVLEELYSCFSNQKGKSTSNFSIHKTIRSVAAAHNIKIDVEDQE